MRLFGRFPAHPGLTNCQGSLSQLHFEAAHCFICHELDLRHKSSPLDAYSAHLHLHHTTRSNYSHLNGNLYETKLNESITTFDADVWNHLRYKFDSDKQF